MHIQDRPSWATEFQEWMQGSEPWQDALARKTSEYLTPIANEMADAVGGVVGGAKLFCWQANELAKPMLHEAYKLVVDYGPFQAVVHAEADPALHALTVAAAAAPTPDFHKAPPDLDNHASWPVLTNPMQREMATWSADAPVEKYIAAAGQQVGRNMILGMELGAMASSAAATKFGAAHAREMLANMARGAASATESTTARLSAYGPAGGTVRLPHTAIADEGMQLNFASKAGSSNGNKKLIARTAPQVNHWVAQLRKLEKAELAAEAHLKQIRSLKEVATQELAGLKPQILNLLDTLRLKLHELDEIAQACQRHLDGNALPSLSELTMQEVAVKLKHNNSWIRWFTDWQNYLSHFIKEAKSP